MARIIEAQSRWSMGKTGAIVAGVSFALGVVYAWEVFGTMVPATIMILWILLIMPVMLGVTAVSHAAGKLGQFGINLSSAVGLWLAGLFIMLMGMAFF